MKTALTTLYMLAAALAALADGTRPIGLYPGSPNDYFGPTIDWKALHSPHQKLSNVALHRVAYASSTLDYNHTAHLVTDGLCDDRQPATLLVSTPEGPLPRREAEWAIDGGKYSRNILPGSHSYLQYDFTGHDNSIQPSQLTIQGMAVYDDKLATKGYSFRVQASSDGRVWQTVGQVKADGLPGELLHYKLHADPNKQEEANLLPARVLQQTVQLRLSRPVTHLRVEFHMHGVAHWDIRELQFSDASGQELELLSSRQFSSMWISKGGRQQWLYTDLGAVVPIHQVVLHWYQPPTRGSIQVSDDARSWTTVADIASPSMPTTSARYVRLLMDEPGQAGYYALREMQVMSPLQKVYTPHVEAGGRGDRYELSGGNWRLQRASEVSSCGEAIASNTFDDSSWIVATVPGTVLASYINIGAVPNPNYADNAEQISESFFRSNFWYRNTFEAAPPVDGQTQWLCFDGINWKANVFLNSQRIGCIEGAFMRGRFNVTGILKQGTNHLAVEIVCNDHFAAAKEKDAQTTQFNGGILGADNPTFHATVGWDWITTVRGREAGIWNEVYLTTTGSVTVADPYLKTELSHQGDTVSITPSVFLRNTEAKAVSGLLKGHIGQVSFQQTVTLPANSEQQVVFLPSCHPQLRGTGFHLWWPNGYGQPYLYDAGFTFTPHHGTASSLDFKAGLRQVEYVDANDSLRIYVNGRRFIPKGGNWGFDEHNLLYRNREYDIAVDYHRDMHFTMIRNWVGQIGDEGFFEACDRHGIMVWQDFWLANPADGPDPYDNLLFLANAADFTRRMRSHPCLALYCGRNEGFPPESLDRKLRQLVHELAPGLQYISHSSSQGVSGGGPYRALPIADYFSKQSGKIHSERGMPNVMNIESLRRTFPPEALWPQSKQWGQHDFTLQGAQRSTLFNDMVNRGLGQARSAEEFSRWAQLISYNGYRAMFEATSSSRAGLLLWMSHPCWPSMVWQTYDYYFEPTAAYFGAKKACEPLHIQYNALTDSVEVVNHSAPHQSRLTAVATAFDLQGRKIGQRKATISSHEDTTLPWIKRADLLPTIPTAVYFLRLQLLDRQGVVSENLYILGREKDNYQALATLPQPQVVQQTTCSGDSSLLVTLTNRGKTPAVFLRLNLKGADGEQILPVTYSDNYLTLMPGESRTISLCWRVEDGRGVQPRLEITALMDQSKLAVSEKH